MIDHISDSFMTAAEIEASTPISVNNLGATFVYRSHKMGVMNIAEAEQKIKSAGPQNVRVVPGPGQAFGGLHQIEICIGGAWTPIVTGLQKHIAESIVNAAINRVICG